MPKGIVEIWNKDEMEKFGFTEEEIKRIEELARRKIGYIRYLGNPLLLGSEFKIYIFFYEDLPSYFYREHKDDGILTFKICRDNFLVKVSIKCIDIQLD